MKIQTNTIDSTVLRQTVVDTASQKDYGAALLFQLLYKGKVLNDTSVDQARNPWYAWCGNHWEQVATAVVRAAAVEEMAPLYEMLADEFYAQAMAIRNEMAQMDKDGADYQERKRELGLITSQIEVLKKRADAIRTIHGA